MHDTEFGTSEFVLADLPTRLPLHYIGELVIDLLSTTPNSLTLTVDEQIRSRAESQSDDDLDSPSETLPNTVISESTGRVTDTSTTYPRTRIRTRTRAQTRTRTGLHLRHMGKLLSIEDSALVHTTLRQLIDSNQTQPNINGQYSLVLSAEWGDDGQLNGHVVGESYHCVEHPAHRVQLLSCAPYPRAIFQCNVCNMDGGGVVYHCAECRWDCHVRCFHRPVIVSRSIWQQYWRQLRQRRWWSLFLHSLFGPRLLVSLALSLLLQLVIQPFTIACGFLFIVLMREVGRMIALRMAGLETPSGAFFLPFLGVFTLRDKVGENVQLNALIGAAAPLAGGIWSALFAFMGVACKSEGQLGPIESGQSGPMSWSHTFMLIAGGGIFNGLLHLIPVIPVDGGRIAMAIHPFILIIALPIVTYLMPLMSLALWRYTLVRLAFWWYDDTSYYTLSFARRLAFVLLYSILVGGHAIGLDYLVHQLGGSQDLNSLRLISYFH